MAFFAAVVSISSSILLTPFIFFLLVILFLASIGKSIGVRRMYVKTLLTLFEYGRQHIEIARTQARHDEDSGFSSEDDEVDSGSKSTSPEGSGGKQYATSPRRPARSCHARSASLDANGHCANGSAKNGGCGASCLISREALILAPDPHHNRFDQPRLHSRYASSGHLQSPRDSKDEGQVEEEQQPNNSLDNSLSKDKGYRKISFETLKREFELADCLMYIKAGMEAIIEDEVTQCFEAEELRSWNLLTRTNRHYEFISWRLTVIWMLGFLVRYFLLLPLRIIICFVGVCLLTFATAVVGYVPGGSFKRWLNSKVSILCFGVLSSALSAVITYHNPENKPGSGICVANHTSPIDVLVLACDNCYALIGQSHGGFLGLLQRALARASSHIWFERSEVKDREFVTNRLREHVSNPNNPPILIFPEGTCINNTSVMQFKKGSFEVGSVVYPVAIKYDPKFGDAFWNSSKYSMMQYLYMMMSSWAIVCDVWYLPPMHQEEEESAIDFANRVKSVIAHQGGLVDLMWDGQLKRMKAKLEWKEKQQEEFSKRLKVD